MISYRFVPISSQKGVLFLRHPVQFSRENQNSSCPSQSKAISPLSDIGKKTSENEDENMLGVFLCISETSRI